MWTDWGKQHAWNIWMDLQFPFVIRKKTSDERSDLFGAT